jgi:hypothetical protein
MKGLLNLRRSSVVLIPGLIGVDLTFPDCNKTDSGAI